MDALKAIPQFFFDLIGRMVPGSAAFLLLHQFFDPDWHYWNAFIKGITATSDIDTPSNTFVGLAVMLITYALGHILSPLTKKIQRITEKYPSPLKKNESESENYAWLRLHYPGPGGNCAKLRAEFTMYKGLAAACVLGVIASPVLEPHTVWGSVVFALLAVLMAKRGREGHETFSSSVEDFCNAAVIGNSKSPEVIAAEKAKKEAEKQKKKARTNGQEPARNDGAAGAPQTISVKPEQPSESDSPPQMSGT